MFNSVFRIKMPSDDGNIKYHVPILIKSVRADRIGSIDRVKPMPPHHTSPGI